MTKTRYLLVIYVLGFWIQKGAPDCVDDNANCEWWAEVGECLFNPVYMMCNCKLSCNTSSSCSDGVDKNTACKCVFRGSRGLCEHGDIMTSCPHTCSLRQDITCDSPPSFPNAVAIGNRKYTDKVTYMCRYGYRNDGNFGLRACTEDGTWVVSVYENGEPPNCVSDPSLTIPCHQVTFAFEPVSRTSVADVAILMAGEGYSRAECVTWCQRVLGCTHAVYVSGICRLYYNIAVSGAKIHEGDVWKRKYLVEPIYFYN